MSWERHDYSGNAVSTTLVGPVVASDTTFELDDAAGWPDGTNGKFLIAIGRNTSGEEKLWALTRSGTTVLLESDSDRGAEGTTAQSHDPGTPVEHVSGSTDADEANAVVASTLGAVQAKGDVLLGSAANTLGRVAVGANNTVLIADSSQTTGWKKGQVDENVVAASVAGAGLAGGNGTALSVNVDSSSIEVNADTLRVKAAGVTNAMLAGSVVLSKLTVPAPTTYTPAWTGGSPTIGNGTLSGAYFLFGTMYWFRILLVAGSTTTFGSGAWSFGLGGSVTAAAAEQSVAATAFDTSANNRYGGSAIVSASGTTVARVATATDASVGISSILPFTWASGDTLSITGMIETV